MSVNILKPPQIYACDLVTMSHSNVTIQTSNFMLGNTHSDSGGGGGRGGAGDTPIMSSGSEADLTNKVCIDMSKMKRRNRPLAAQVVGMALGMMLAVDNRSCRRIP
ncbi:hypothetical protein L873DRAFT_1815972 [Choiromyces venosus 120613-1]|uniref:Uncharacterized protein n=1 Tax=Choiromyces venosus 120613-1 TaxID=1336337 RepID=A0A3N4J508_9PEZI|nr:hypothetical protein L873DRAFT_1815972 [Choiromyces venosus 120613-1]